MYKETNHDIITRSYGIINRRASFSHLYLLYNQNTNNKRAGISSRQWQGVQIRLKTAPDLGETPPLLTSAKEPLYSDASRPVPLASA